MSFFLKWLKNKPWNIRITLPWMGEKDFPASKIPDKPVKIEDVRKEITDSLKKEGSDVESN